ncbi:MAG: hypothetical protein PHQ75_15430, partial [Thermoguttaceae bacterium]|nr:hypothetical protein [Thermoguttaceae bacterium]
GKLVWLEDRVFTRETLTSTDISGNGTNSYRVSISLSGLASGTYYVVVNRTDAAVDCKNYKLAIQTCSDDRYEVNNTRAEVDAFPEGGVDSPNLGPIFAPDDSSAEVEMELSGLVLKQASPSAISTSEVDAFRFVMTGVGGPNSYIEIQYDNTRYNPNDADLDMYLYSWSGEEYYRQYPGAWGDLVASSIRNEKEGVERISLDGLPAGIYYVKIVGFVNSENILDYKLVFHMRDETDPPGVGVTTDPDYYTTKPDTEEVPYEWESPLVVTSDQYSTYNPEKSGSDKFSGKTLFYSQDKIYYNLSFAVTGRKNDTVEVGYYLNGTLVGTETVPFQVGESTAILTDRALARLTNEHILNASDGSLWEGTEAFDFAFKDGMILSVIDSQNFVTSGYVYMNGNFVAISDTVELANAESLTLADGTKVVYYKQTLIESGLTNVVTKTSTVKSLTGTSVPLTFVSKNESYAVSYNSNTRVFSITIPGGSQEVTFKSGSVFVYGSTYLTYVNSGTQDLFYISNVNSTAETKSTTYDGVFRSYVSEYITGSSIALTMLTATGSRSVTYNSSQDKFVDSSGTVTVASGTVFSYYDVAADETSYLTYVPRYFTGATNAMTMIAADGTESLVNFNAERNSFTSNNSAITVTAGTKFYYTDDTGERVNMTYYKNGRFIVFFDSYVDLTKLGESKVGDVIDVSGRTLTTDEGVSLYYDYAQQEFYVLTSMANGTVMTYTEGTETTTLYYQGIYLSKTSAALYKGYEIGDALMLRSAPDTFNTNLSYNGTLLSYSNGSFYKKGTTQKVNIALGTILTWTDPADSTNTRGVLYNTDPSGNTTNKGLYVSLDNPLDDGAIVNVGTDEFMFRDSNFYAEYGEVADGTRLLFDSG